MELLTAILILILVSLPLLVILFPSKKKQRINECMAKLPGPPVYPIVGSATELIFIKREDVATYVEKRNKKYGPIFKLWIGSFPTVHILKAEYFEKILSSNTNITKTILYDYFKPWLGNGLVIAGGSIWHRNRKLITPAFHFKILDQFVEVFDEKARHFVDILSPMTGKQFDMYPYITKCALEVICETAMGVQLNAMSKSPGEYVEAIYQFPELALKKLRTPWARSDWLYSCTAQGKQHKRCLDILHGFTSKVLEDRKKSPRKAGEISGEDELLGKKRRLAFLDLLLETSKNGPVLTDQEIRQEVDTFLFAGHDTISTLVCWCLLLLGNNPDVQERVREEVKTFYPTDRKLTIADLNEMNYLERVIKETLRLYPSAPTVGRSLTEDVVLDKYVIPAGTSVIMHFSDVHRSEEHFPDPDKFDPDRFLPENSRNRHPYSYVPFSAGPRNCVGQKFAMYEGKVLIANVIKNYKVKSMVSAKDVKMYKEIIIKPQTGLQVTLERC